MRSNASYASLMHHTDPAMPVVQSKLTNATQNGKDIAFLDIAKDQIT